MNGKSTKNSLIQAHGGYKKLRTYILGTLIYDATVAFCLRYLSRKDRTFDQMVQATRSGVANIIEGSTASATSKKTELKLTNVARASQEELLTDYRAFLRQRSLPEWSKESPAVKTVRLARPETLDQLRLLMAEMVSDPALVVPQSSSLSDKDSRKAEVAGNVMICLICQETYLLARQISRLAADFEQNGGFTERLHRIRSDAKGKGIPHSV